MIRAGGTVAVARAETGDLEVQTRDLCACLWSGRRNIWTLLAGLTD